jgi:hypothetical protein
MSGPSAQVAELALACRGTVSHGEPGPGTDYYPGVQGNPEPVSMSIVLNFTTRKVEITGFGLLFPLSILHTTEAVVVFGGNSEPWGGSRGFNAMINRLTGEMEASDTDVQANGLYSTTIYALKCRPVQKMF